MQSGTPSRSVSTSESLGEVGDTGRFWLVRYLVAGTEGFPHHAHVFSHVGRKRGAQRRSCSSTDWTVLGQKDFISTFWTLKTEDTIDVRAENKK